MSTRHRNRPPNGELLFGLLCAVTMLLVSGGCSETMVAWDATYRDLLGPQRAKQLAGQPLSAPVIGGPSGEAITAKSGERVIEFIHYDYPYFDQLLEWRNSTAGKTFMEMVGNPVSIGPREVVVIVEECSRGDVSGKTSVFGKVIWLKQGAADHILVTSAEGQSEPRVMRGVLAWHSIDRIRWGLGLLKSVSGRSKPFCVEWDLYAGMGHRVAFITVITRDGVRQFLHDKKYYDEEQGGSWIADAPIYTEYQLVGRFWTTLYE